MQENNKFTYEPKKDKQNNTTPFNDNIFVLSLLLFILSIIVTGIYQVLINGNIERLEYIGYILLIFSTILMAIAVFIRDKKNQRRDKNEFHK